MTAEEREGIREAARRYVNEQAPTPPNVILERVARIVRQSRPVALRSPNHSGMVDEGWGDGGQQGAA